MLDDIVIMVDMVPPLASTVELTFHAVATCVWTRARTTQTLTVSFAEVVEAWPLYVQRGMPEDRRWSMASIAILDYHLWPSASLLEGNSVAHGHLP